MNEERERRGWPKYANPRNAAAGTVRVLEPNITAQRRLDFYAYFLLRRWASVLRQQSDSLEALAKAGFKVNPNRKLLRTIDDVLGVHQRRWEEQRDKLPLRDRRRRHEGELARTAARAWASPARLRAGRSRISTRRARA